MKLNNEKDLEKDFDGFYMPKEICDLPINIKYKVYLSILKQTKNESLTDYLMSYAAPKITISRIKKELKKLGYIEEETFDPYQAQNKVIREKNSGITCEWCGYKTNAIQEHHFPIPKCKGGKEVVKICPNCHFEYHRIMKEE